MREIAAFARLNHRKKDATAELSEVEKRLSGWEDAEEAVMLADESVPGCIKLQVGECFVDTDSSAASDVVRDGLASDRAQKERLAATLAATVAEMDALKKKLYGRFGTSISLED